MKIIIAQKAGFCGGVKRAYEMTKKNFFKKKKNQKLDSVFILGSLVHNDGVAKEVESWGIRKIKNLKPVKKNSIVIITAHGAPKEIYEKITQKGARIFDATCPKVALIHELVKSKKKAGFQVIIFGNKNHKEVKGIASWGGNNLKIIDSFKEAQKLWKEHFSQKAKKIQKTRKVLLISQTTQPVLKFEKIKNFLKQAFCKGSFSNLEIIDTICQTTFDRQIEAQIISRKCQSVIVVGGKQSANTRNLFKIAQKNNKNTFWIDSPEKIKNLKKIKNFSSVGILSGASTPIEDIKKTASLIRKMNQKA